MEIDICMPIADSLCSTAETKIILQSTYSLIKKLILKKNIWTFNTKSSDLITIYSALQDKVLPRCLSVTVS